MLCLLFINFLIFLVFPADSMIPLTPRAGSNYVETAQPDIYPIPRSSRRNFARQQNALPMYPNQMQNFPPLLSKLYSGNRPRNAQTGSTISIANIPGQQLAISSSPGGSHTIIHIPPPSSTSSAFQPAFAADPTLAALRQVQAAQLHTLPTNTFQTMNSVGIGNPSTVVADQTVIKTDQSILINISFVYSSNIHYSNSCNVHNSSNHS